MKKVLIPIIAILAIIGIGLEINAVVGIEKAKIEAQQALVLNSKYSKKELNKMKLPQLSTKVNPKTETKVVMDTSAGKITIKLFKKDTPLAVKNFVQHAKDGYYNGTEFFRVMKDFMFQGGDPQNNGQGGESIWKDKDKKIDNGQGFKNEIKPNLYFIYGALGMANSGADTNGSQFFIVSNKKDMTKDIQSKKSYPDKILKAYKNGGVPFLDGSYTVFGQVIDGFDVLETIQNQEVETSETGESSKPINPYVINSITVE